MIIYLFDVCGFFGGGGERGPDMYTCTHAK